MVMIVYGNEESTKSLRDRGFVNFMGILTSLHNASYANLY
jgi:hypothetical protein